MSSAGQKLPDAAERAKILSLLDRTLLVEAAAGTGKTASMVGRMAALLGEGRCRVDQLAGVTFTRKAAAELRSRFQAALEEACRKETGEKRERLRQALSHIEGCFIGTIHSFCARLLRERPVEAGVGIDFREMDDDENDLLRKRDWDEFLAELHATDDPLVERLSRLGLTAGDLGEAYACFAGHADVPLWPAPETPLPDTKAAVKALRAYAGHIISLLPELPEDPGSDKLVPALRLLVRMERQSDPDDPAELMEILAECKEIKQANVRVTRWPGGKERAKAELERWNDFAREHALPLVAAWRQRRYPVVMETFRRAAERYERTRLGAGLLNYQDLLVLAARLLRDKPRVRLYFRERYSHLLVDEFQDTDPVQAEVLLLLTAGDPGETEARQCRPVPGSLFVVGDPKQSIYRFRRADLVTYNKFKEIVLESGGEVVFLSTNFRSGRPIIEWVNNVFRECFPNEATETSPAHVPLAAPPGEPRDAAVEALPFPDDDLTRKDLIVPREADLVARCIKRALDDGLSLPRSPREIAEGIGPEARPGDFLIITRNTSQLGLYSERLREHQVPHEVTGGQALNRVRELDLLHRCLTAVLHPDDPVALVAALRGELFGFSDAALYRYKRAGGRFAWHSPVPDGLPHGEAGAFTDAFALLKKYALWFSRLPPVSVVELAAADLGLTARAAASPGGNALAGSLGKALEILRAAQQEFWTAADIVAYLGEIVAGEEKHDAADARPPSSTSARVMNLHKVKGLEAPVVFLADPTGESDHEPMVHIDRSESEPRGYMAVFGTRRGWTAPLLAHPPGWEELAGKESRFAEDENIRLLYVAATRAGARLVISRRRDSRKRDNPWQFFEPYLKDRPEMADPGPMAAVAEPPAALEDSEVERARLDIGERWRFSLAPTYAAAAAKEISLAAAPIPREHPSSGEHGTEWGSVIHLLLQAAMARPKDDLAPLAVAALSDRGLDIARARDALDLVRRVMDSDLWHRAQAGRSCLTEVPFQRFVPAGEAPAVDLPLMLRGVIDLAFREPEGWVIIDYKTDDRPGEPLEALASKYAAQVSLYADEWGRITGEPVVEKGIYFVHSGRLIPLP